MKKHLLYTSVLLVPALASAQVTIDGAMLQLVNNFVDVIINPLIVLLIAAALLIFFWGLFQFMVDLSQGGTGEEGKRHMLWGIVGLIIMISVGGIINLIAQSVGSSTSVEVEEL